MGSLAEEYGYYDNGESLLVGNPHEAFIFHILPDGSGKSAVWVAERVDDDHVGAVTNSFTVRILDFLTRKGSFFLQTCEMWRCVPILGHWRSV